MANLNQLLHVKILRFIYGRSPFRTVVIITVIALALILLSKVQILKMELQTNEGTDSKYNPKIITAKKILIPTVSTIRTTPQISQINYTNKSIISKVVTKKQGLTTKIYSGHEIVNINISFNLNKENIIKVATNDILLKGLNEDSIKLHNSLNDKPFDYDKNARFCTCTKISQPCVCCVKLAEENIGLVKSLCSNITYLPKLKAAKISMQYGDTLKSDNDVLIDINNPPAVCLSEFFKYSNLLQGDNQERSIAEEVSQSNSGNFTLDICFQPKNLTYNVNIDTSHRTEFKGCSNINVKLKNMFIHVYPMGCFKAGNDAKELLIQNAAHGIP